MDAKRQARLEKKKQLLRELAELNIEEMNESGVFEETPHFSVIERAAHAVGQELSHELQERASREAVANCDAKTPCPTCGTICDARAKRRTIESVDGPVELTETVAHCRQCRRSFFPSPDGDGAR